MQLELALDSRERNIEECGYPYKFSVVVPVYNTEQYLEETLESVVHQTIGFEDNIQLILVNNATEDNAGEICERYRHLYPDNVVYIKLEQNAGPSGARNAGIPYIQGKYVNFLDSDDKWGLKAFAKVWHFFELNKEKISVVVCRMRFFDNERNFHLMDFRFKAKSKQIISIFDKYEYIQLHINNVFFDYLTIGNNLFDECMQHGEDTKFFTQVVLQEGKYALLKRAQYNYRKHKGNLSLLDFCKMQSSYYTSDFQKLLKELFNNSFNAFAEYIPYVQILALYIIIYRIRDGAKNQLQEEEQQIYKDIIREALQNIEDDLISNFKFLTRDEKTLLLNIKYSRDISDDIRLRHKTIYFNGISLYSLKSKTILKICNIDFADNNICITGKVALPLSATKYKVVAVINDNDDYDLSYFELDISAKKFYCNSVYYQERGFKVVVPVAETEKISFVFLCEHQNVKLYINFQFVSRLTNKLKNSYYIANEFLLRKNKASTAIFLERFSKERKRQLENKITKELFKSKRFRTVLWRLLIRFANFIHRLSNKEIWLFIDYFSLANDNAEALFQYVLAQNNNKIKPYFVISKNTEDYNRIKQYGKVISYDTKLYRLLFAVSDKIITSQTFYSRRNTFYERTDVLKDLFHFKYIYLQHGIIKDNHADTLAHYKTALDMLITSAKLEYDSLMSEEYQLTSDIVKLTGLARYDKLAFINKNISAKKILLAPTWRKSQIGEWNETIQGYKYQENFKKTEFYAFYNGILTDSRVLEALSKHGYIIEVQLHPRLWSQNCDFVENDYIRVEHVKKPLIEEIQETAMLITDYSSIAFDYSYIKIPIIYAQFDKESFYANHAYTRGYFDFETMGFGPVCYDYESTVQAIIKAIENDCVMEERYKQRVDNFFAYRDGKNCERIYNEILKLDKD